MDDNNTISRRLALLKRLDLMLGQEQDSYNPSDLDTFMHDQGPSDGWREKLRSQLEKIAGSDDSYSWSHRKEYPPGTTYDFSKIGDMSDEEMIQIAKDLKIPPYHLSAVDEHSQDEDIPTGEYEVCQRCSGDGCSECEGGLKDITGVHKALNLDDFEGE